MTDEIVEGYFDGLASDLDEIQEGNNRSPEYQFGWKNGRDDRLKKPRMTAAEIRVELSNIREMKG